MSMDALFRFFAMDTAPPGSWKVQECDWVGSFPVVAFLKSSMVRNERPPPVRAVSLIWYPSGAATGVVTSGSEVTPAGPPGPGR